MVISSLSTHSALLISISLELHDALGALSGLGASTRAVLKELRFMRRVSFDVVIITTFFTAISILHVVVPIVISVDTTTRLIAISSTNAATMPGQVLDLGISAAAGAPPGRVDLPDALNTAIITLRYMYNQRSDSSMGLPRGFNDSYVDDNTKLICLTLTHRVP